MQIIKIKKEDKPFFILFVIALIVHLFLPLNWGDDAIFSSECTVGLSEFLVGSSRILTDSMTYIFSRYHILWRLLNPFILVFLAIILSKLLTCKDEYLKNTVLCITIIYPTMIIVDAGFIATTVNYLWPVTFGLFSLIPLKKVCIGKCIHWYEWLIGIPLLVYALNMEQMCAILTVVFFVGSIYLLKNKNLHPYIILQFFITIGGLIYSYISNTSGDNSRMVRETSRYFPNFNSLTLLNKIELGFSSTFYCMTMELRFASIAFLAFSLFLAISVIKKTKHKSSQIISLFPFVFSFIFSLLSLLPNKYITFIKYLTGGMQHYRMTKATYSFKPIPDILFILVCLCSLYSIYLLLENKKKVLEAFSVLGLGLASRIIMGFSPTVWASGYRTFCIMFISFIIVVIIIINERIELKNNNLTNELMTTSQKIKVSAKSNN